LIPAFHRGKGHPKMANFVAKIGPHPDKCDMFHFRYQDTASLWRSPV
jgi:hypothetical protein